MNIIINASSIFKGGAEQVVHSFINECIKHPKHTYHIFLRDNIKSQLDLTSFPGNFKFYDIRNRPGKSIFHILKAVRHFQKIAQKIKPDAVISTGGHGFWLPDIPVIGGFNIPHYVYPESPYFNNISLKRKLYWKLKKVFDLYFYRKLDAVVVQTEDVKQRLSKLISDVPIYTISNTVNATFNRREFDKSPLPEKKEGEFRLLTVSANYPHKNLEIIKDVIRVLIGRGETNIKFVLTLPEESYKIFEDPKFEKHIINLGPVSIDQCPAIYRDCDAMFLPTLLECFSASYAEAMRMKRPILTSDLGFARTVCKHGAIYFDPLDSRDIADQILKLVYDRSLYETLADEGRREFTKLMTPAERAECFLYIAELLVNKSTQKAHKLAI